jgi:hypothetical protein
MPIDGEITEVSAAVDFAIVDDRLHFTLTSGSRKQTFAISFHRARAASQACMRLLDQRERDSADNVRDIKRRPRGVV